MGATLSPSLEDSFRAAQGITREHARTFYFASHVLPASIRKDAYAIYACCRSIDDAVDQVAGRGELVRPEVAGEMLMRAFESGGDEVGEEWMPAFRDTVARKKIRRRWFEDLAIGVAGDAGPVNVQTWEELDLYCYRVAGTVGLMMMRVFGSEDPLAEPRALDLGRGMQLTNILRDVAEDARARRIYLPARERDQYGVRAEDLFMGRPSGHWAEFMQSQLSRAREQYKMAEAGIAFLPSRGAQMSVWLMRELYAGILDSIERSGYDVFTRRHSLSLEQKIGRGIRVWWNHRSDKVSGS